MQPDESSNDRWMEPARSIPVVNETDVLVVGAGPAGVSAAIAAGRAGARTLLVENSGYFGGMWTYGMQTHATCFHNGKETVVGGIARELIDILVSRGAAQDPDEKLKTNPKSWYSAFDPEMMKCVLDTMVVGAGVTPLLHTCCVGAMVEDGYLKGIITESKSGREAVKARVTIDCTGDADVAFHAGAPTIKGRSTDGRCQPVTLTFLLEGADFNRMGQWVNNNPQQVRDIEQQARRRGELSLPKRVGFGALAVTSGVSYHNVTRVLNIDATCSADLTRAEIEARKQVLELVEFYRKYVPGFENVRLRAIAPSIGLRESRRIVGEYTLTAEDVVSARAFPDGIARQNYYIDMHNPDGDGAEPDTRHGDRPEPGTVFEIPYRCLLPEKIRQLLVAGRCLSATREAAGAARVTVCCAQMGQAAGLAAAEAVKNGRPVHEIDGAELKAALL